MRRDITTPTGIGANLNPSYNVTASKVAGVSVSVFLLTFGYMFFYSGVAPSSHGGGVAFCAAGILAVSLFVTTPMFILQLKAPAVAPFVFITDLAITIFVTRFVYLALFSSAG